MLKSLLLNCGLTDNEQQILTYLISQKGSIASVITKKTSIKRSTVYLTLKRLQQKGLVQSYHKQSVTYFSSAPTNLIPNIIQDSAKQNYQHINQSAELLHPHLKELTNKQTAQNHHFQNITIESIQGVYAQVQDSILGGDFCSIFNPQKAMVGQFKEGVKEYLKKTAEFKPHIKEIAVSGPETQWYKKNIKNPNHQLKEIPSNTNIISDFILLKGSVIILDYTPGQEQAIKISQENHYKSFMSLFQLLWQKL